MAGNILTDELPDGAIWVETSGRRQDKPLGYHVSCHRSWWKLYHKQWQKLCHQTYHEPKPGNYWLGSSGDTKLRGHAQLAGVAGQVAFDPLDDRAWRWIGESARINNIVSVNCYTELAHAASLSAHAELCVPR